MNVYPIVSLNNRKISIAFQDAFKSRLDFQNFK